MIKLREFFLRTPFILEFSFHTPFCEPLFLGALGWIREEVKRASVKFSQIKEGTFLDRHSKLIASLAMCATVGRSHSVKKSDSGRLRVQCPSQECS